MSTQAPEIEIPVGDICHGSEITRQPRPQAFIFDGGDPYIDEDPEEEVEEKQEPWTPGHRLDCHCNRCERNRDFHFNG